MTLGWRLNHKLYSRHNGRYLCLSCTIMWRTYKKDFPNLNLRPWGSLFPTQPLGNSIFSMPMGGVPVILLWSDEVFDNSVRTGKVSATMVQLGGFSALTRAIYVIGLSQRKSTFPLSVLQKYLIYLPWGRIYVLTKQLYGWIKKIYSRLKWSLPLSWFCSDILVKMPWEHY